MTMDHYTAHEIDVSDPELGSFLHEGISSDTKDMGKIGSVMEVLTTVDLDLAYSSEKIGNLDNLLMHVLAWENDFETLASDDISEESIEKASTFDLLSGILGSEVRKMDRFMGTLRVLLVDSREKISSWGHLRELFAVVEGKLHDSEDSLKQSQEHVLEMKMVLAKLQIRNNFSSMTVSRDFQVSNVDVKPQMQTVEHRHVLRMLEKSLARELDLEKKLTESKQNEEDLKLKVRLTEQVAFCMEEAAEVVWGRFLEAENTAEVLMGTSKEMVGRLQIVQFTRKSSVQREEELKSGIQDFSEKLKDNDTAIQKLNSRITQLITNNSEVLGQVNLLEDQLRDSELKLKNAKASNEESEEQLREMERTIESLKENIDALESRAQSAEAKSAQLQDTNLELTEEIGFLKGNQDSDTKKVSSLEKQLRELELQLQYARASSEASQEQQNMLYSAIWDMETLIDELKQNVSKAESKTERAEEQCIILTDTNLEITKEVDILRARVECLETSLNEANVEKIASAKDVSIKTNLIMDMVMQIATEREHIKKKLHSLTMENRILTEKLQKTTKEAFGGDDKEIQFPKHDLSNAATIEEVATESLSKSFQVEQLPKDAPTPGTEVESSALVDDSNNSLRKLESTTVVDARKNNRKYAFLTLLILLLSLLAAYVFNNKTPSLNVYDG